MNSLIESNRPPLPPFTYEAAVQKVRMAEDAWYSRGLARIVPTLSDFGF